MSHLDDKYTAELEDVITNPTQPTGSCERIKTVLIRRLSLSVEQRVHQLLMHEEMCDRRLTQFLRHLRTLTGLELEVNQTLLNFFMSLEHITQNGSGRSSLQLLL